MLFEFLQFGVPSLSPELIRNAVIGIIVFIVCGSVHEFSHAAAAYRLGDNTAQFMGRMTLNPMRHVDLLGTIIFPLINIFSPIPVFGWMKPVPTNTRNFKRPDRDQAIVAAAGPYSNLLLFATGIAVMYLLGFLGIPILQYDIAYLILRLFIIINLMLALFNLLPVPPLDGGWILRYFLPARLQISFDRIYQMGSILLLLLLWTGGLNFISYIATQIMIFINVLQPWQFFMIYAVVLTIPVAFFWASIYDFLWIRKDRVQQAQKGHQAKKEFKRTISSNEGLRDKAALYMENKGNLQLTDNDQTFYNTLVEQFNPEDNICPPVDFDYNDPACLNCEWYHNCTLRNIKKFNQSHDRTIQ